MIDGNYVVVPEALPAGETMYYTTPAGIKVDIKRDPSGKKNSYHVIVRERPGCMCSCPISPQIAGAKVGGLNISLVEEAVSIVQD